MQKEGEGLGAIGNYAQVPTKAKGNGKDQWP